MGAPYVEPGLNWLPQTLLALLLLLRVRCYAEIQSNMGAKWKPKQRVFVSSMYLQWHRAAASDFGVEPGAYPRMKPYLNGYWRLSLRLEAEIWLIVTSD